MPLLQAGGQSRPPGGAESALMLGEQARAIDEARVARLVGDSSTFAESLHVRLMAARVLAWAR